MKKLLCILLSTIFCLFYVISFAEEETYLSNNRIELYVGEDEVIYYYDDLNPMTNAQGCDKLYTPREVFLCLDHRGVDIRSYTTKVINNRRYMVIELNSREKYAFEIIETRSHDHFILEETVRQFCYHYFGDNYDFLGNDPF